jgi:pyruvate formate lyase activating enzyme
MENTKSKAIITNIQKYSVHDGPGIRNTVFLKGCPLSCWWCHNPETQSYKQQLMYDREKCNGCSKCINGCPQNAIKLSGEKVLVDAEKCNFCGSCLDYCINCSRSISGKEYSVQELMNELEKDRTFYEQSNGGITLSGGEPMTSLHIDFVERVVNECHKKGISVMIDTCGYAPYENYKRINDKVDMYLYDIKHMDPVKHKMYTGIENVLILENLKRLSQDKVKINLRLPLIEGINTDDENIKATIDMAKTIDVYQVNLLPYHDIAKDKYSRLNLHYDEKNMETPSKERMEWIKEQFENNKFDTRIGG